MYRKVLTFCLSPLFLFLTACEDIPSVSILSDSARFEQASSSVNNKIDILWVVDNSGSMENLQANVAANFSAFIADFQGRGFDFQMAVTTTEAWREQNGNVYCPQQSGLARYRDEAGVAILNRQTPDLEAAFLANIRQGVNGCGDERAFASLLASLTDADNLSLGFPRQEAFLAIILVSDEDDFSHPGGDYLWNDYQDPRLSPVADIVSALDQFTGSSTERRRHSVSAIAIFDEDCLNQNTPWGLIGRRYEELVTATDGLTASVCSQQFASELQLIGEQILVLSSQFYLSRQPIVESIRVIVDGVEVVEDANIGWTYIPESNSILFAPPAIPSQGASIQIDFDPVSLIN